MKHRVRLGAAWRAVILASAASAAFAGSAGAASHCTKNNEVTAIQATAVQQQLMVAALTCSETANFNAFQIGYGKELRRSDGDLLRMFKRFYGGRGEKEYHAFKTRIANDSSMRSIRDNPSYCAAAKTVFAAALVAQKPTLAHFVSSVGVTETGPFSSCEIKVAIGLDRPAPSIIPKPKPADLGLTTAQAGPVTTTATP